MPRSYANLVNVLALRSPTAAETADANGTEMTDARLASWVSGILLVQIASVDVASTDEVYDFILQGRQASADAYTELARIGFAAAAATVGVHIKSVDRFYKRMRLVLAVGGTTPSVLYTATAICLEFTYGPGAQTLTS